jgi:hypothetical protein
MRKAPRPRAGEKAAAAPETEKIGLGASIRPYLNALGISR